MRFVGEQFTCDRNAFQFIRTLQKVVIKLCLKTLESNELIS